ncbi:MAG: hypothetical protein ACYDG3_11735, partial [Bacillati bacterium]
MAHKHDFRNALAPALIGIAFAALTVAQIGVPALRQDWSWPVGAQSSLAALERSFFGWAGGGFGQPSPVLSGYMLEPLLALLRWLFGSHLALVIYVAAVGFVVASGAARIAGRCGASWIGRTALALFAVFNPWTYNEIVAGHLNMILSLGATLLIMAEVLGDDLDALRLALFTALAYVQLQFFLIDVVVLTVACIRARRWLPVVTAAVIALPSIIGVVSSWRWLAATPFLPSWQIQQSVPLLKGMLLSGYFVHYASALPRSVLYALLILCALALAGAVHLRGRFAYVGLFGIAALVAASGAKGPLGALYLALVVRLPWLGLFRELYDLIGLVIVAYVVALGAAFWRFPKLALIGLAAAMVMAGSWIVAPPRAFWVDALRLPTLRIGNGKNTRFALMPAFQPLSFRGRGSGADPDVFSRAGGRNPLNGYLVGYPANAALAGWTDTHSAIALEALSVSVVINRPWFRTVSLAQFRPSSAVGSLEAQRPMRTKLDPIPEFSLLSRVMVVRTPSAPGTGAVFFADLPDSNPERGTFTLVRPPLDSMHGGLGWIPVILAEVKYPWVAQGLGGAYTSSRAPLRIASAKQVLVVVRGRLTGSDGKVLTYTTYGYRWIALPLGTSSVVCDGACVVVATGEPPAIAPRSGRPGVVAVRGDWLAPWLARISLPPNSSGLLRVNNAFSPGWVALQGFAQDSHLRVDTAANGWIIRRSSHAQAVVVFFWPAALQCLAELAALLYIAWLFFRRKG